MSTLSIELDDVDRHWLIDHKWRIWQRVTRSGRVYRYVIIMLEGRMQYLHRLITAAEPGRVVDHINGDGLDNRRQNIRVCEHRENTRNRRLSTNNTTGFKGVTHEGGQFCARIKCGPIRLYKGRFRTAQEAARQYAEWSARLHGQYGWVAQPAPAEPQQEAA